MNKYVYLGTSENLNHRGYSTDILYEITIHKDCFYEKSYKVSEGKLDLKYLKHFKSLQELIKRAIHLNHVREVCKLTVKNRSFKYCNEYFSYEAIECIEEILGVDNDEENNLLFNRFRKKNK